MKRRRLVIVTIGALAVVALLAVTGWRHVADMAPRRAAENYLSALATGDIKAARTVSSGKAAEAAGKLEGKNLVARVDEIFTSVQALGRGWARVKATVELTLADGTADVGWYELDVMKETGGWKVVSFREGAPDLSGWSLVLGRARDVEAAKEVFAGYLEALAAGKWDEAVKYLAGPARKSMEASRDVLSTGKIIGRVDDLQAKLVWASGKEMVVEFSYKADAKAVELTAELYHTPQGWRITALR